MNDQDSDASAGSASRQDGARANPVLAFGTVLIALVLFAVHLLETLANPRLGFLVTWSVAGLVCSLLVLTGVWRGHALAYRFGVVLAPIGSALFLLSSLLFVEELGVGWVPTLGIVALGVFTPIAWVRGSVKRVFGLVCPQCRSLRIGAESFTFYERRCWACGTVFRPDGTILRVGPGPAPPAPSGVTAAALDMAAPDIPSTPPTSPSYAIPLGPGVPQALQGPAYVYTFEPGTPGKVRDHTWFIVFSSLVLGMGLIMYMIAFAQGILEAQRGISPDPRASDLELIGGMFACGGMAGVIIMLIYWLVWVYKVHKEMRVYTNFGYAISPGKALGFCFIPLFNIFWRIYMPYKLAEGVRQYLGHRSRVFDPGSVLAFYILALVPGSCVLGLDLLFTGLGMREVQKGLNVLWTEGSPWVSSVPPE